ncbi:hypothetical protein CJF42_13855 [Pseudoalteromonas sp. NBT06-2]|nr:hypothetical protein CJF42_13855 [Pseudoalteromonas sp. NBT06-2]
MPLVALATPTFWDFFNKHNSIMLLIDPRSGHIKHANNAASQFYGYSQKQLQSMTIQQVNTLTPKQVSEERRLAEQQGRNFFIFRHRLANSEIKTVEVYSVPLNFDGKTLLYSIIRDISKERGLEADLWHYQTQLEAMVELQTKELKNQSELLIYIFSAAILFMLSLILVLVITLRHVNSSRKKLIKNEKELRLAAGVFETASEAVMITNTQNQIIKVNNAFSDITGYRENEVINHSLTQFKFTSEDAVYLKNIFTIIENQGHWQGELWSKKKNGERYLQKLAVSTMKDPNNHVEGYVFLFSDITQRKADEKRIWKQANFDSLTGLANRGLFIEHFSRSIERAKRSNKLVALLFIDLDRFKYINDTFGHAAGDLLLIEAGNRINKNLRKADTVARFGGDEFALVLPDINDLHNVEAVVNKLLISLSLPYDLKGKKAIISASIGIAIYPENGSDIDILLRNADSAMYKSKEIGRNTSYFFTHAMDVEAQRRRALEQALHSAVKNNELSLNFQPIINLKTGEVASCEALICWQHSEFGIISPEEFIPLAEDVGLIIPIGEWVLKQACNVAMSWFNSKQTKIPSISVNLSSYQFKKQDITKLVKQILFETGLPASRLILEITESLLVNDDESTLNQLEQLRALDVSISIDHFGTGYSSLSYLKKFPINYLKIDKSFVIDLVLDNESRALIEGIVSMAKSLKLDVTAEGVESNAQATFLKSLNCSFAQGYLYSKPLTEIALNRYLEKIRYKL